MGPPVLISESWYYAQLRDQIGRLKAAGEDRSATRLRLTDLIKIGGEWVSSLQLEDRIMHRDGISECAVTGVKDARWGERLLALIARNPKTEQPVSADDIKAHLMTFADKGVISKFAAPQKIIFVEALG